MIDCLRSLKTRANEPTDVAALVVFRVLLGLLVSISALRFLAYGWVDELFVKPTFFFTYYGVSWVRALPHPWMHVVFGALVVLGACFAAGLFYRRVAPILFVLFTYVQLIDVTNWLNHYYLVSLLLLLASFMPLGRAGSVDVKLRGVERLDAFPAWCTWLVRFQIGVVYVSAGLAKVSSDWLLHAQPLNIWLSARTGTPVFGALFDQRWVAYAFSWGGFLFDTTIPFFLMWGRTRRVALCVLVVFHAIVGALFPIGMFPFIMVAAALVFLPESWPRLIWKRGAMSARILVQSPSSSPRRWRIALACAYCILQIALPLRHHLYDGNVAWHEQGMRLAWNVMVREKNGNVTYLVSSQSARRTWYVDPKRYLTDRQERELGGQPDLILQLAHHIANDFRGRGVADVEVRAEAFVSLNGRSSALMIDPNVDLARVDDGIGRAAWILPAPTTPPIHLRYAWSHVATR